MRYLIFALLIGTASAQEYAVFNPSPEYHVTASAGVSYQSKSENGTWWDSQYPHSFKQAGQYLSVGFVSRDWSIELDDLGVEKTFCYCSGTGYDSRQHPFGAWVIWEPTPFDGNKYRNPFLRFGGGIYRPDFSVRGSNGGELGNNHVTAGYLLGFGLPTSNRHVNAIIDVRYIGSRQPQPQPQDFPALGKFDVATYLRWSF